MIKPQPSTDRHPSPLITSIEQYPSTEPTPIDLAWIALPPTQPIDITAYLPDPYDEPTD